MQENLNVAVLEPYYGGSHAAFIDALKLRSRHKMTVLTLPARKWKWRMRGAAIWLAREAAEWMPGSGGRKIDVILCSDMLSVADLRALLPPNQRNIPIVCYFHENQLTYPIPNERERDYQYGMTNITSCLAAEAVWFNSRFHLEDFLVAVGRLLAKMPDYVPNGVVSEIRSKSDVLPPPVLADRVDRPSTPTDRSLTILWCHRWEYDKNPEPFFDTLMRLDEEGCAFDLVLLGEQFRAAPRVFADVLDRLRSHIVHAGYIPDRAEYLSHLARCDVVVSTAIQENFGIAVVEAILAGCQPLLPNRLAYPELIPVELHTTCLYPSDGYLLERLRRLIRGQGRLGPAACADLQASVESRFGAAVTVARLDDALVSVVERVPQHYPNSRSSGPPGVSCA